jgi:hydroxymethylpyrimidine pyrophosphatase-like HAD family hydrolase
MKGKLYKSLNSDTYLLTVDGKLFADTEGGPLMAITNKLSVKNCIDIKNGYDLMKLAEENSHKYYDVKTTDWHCNYNGFFSGFQKAMELNKDKVFTEEDMRKAYFDGYNDKEENRYFNPSKSLQQPIEIDVEIKMEPCFYDQSLGGFSTSYTEDKPKEQPKLDKDGCLILKKI